MMSPSMHLEMNWRVRIISCVVIVALTCFPSGAECKRSACWRYGHVCWGGHGKRSDHPALISATDSLGKEDTNRYPAWNPQLPFWKANAKLVRSMHTSKSPMNRRQFYPPTEAVRHPLPSPVFTLEAGLLQRQSSQIPVPYQRVSNIAPENDKQLYKLAYDIGKGDAFGDDGFRIMPTDSSEISSYSSGNMNSALKRASDEIQGGSSSGISNGSTEEPLVTSANGLDSRGGAMATFFRDRKPVKSNLNGYMNRGEKEQPSFSPQRLQHNSIYDILPLAPYRADSLSRSRYYY